MNKSSSKIMIDNNRKYPFVPLSIEGVRIISENEIEIKENPKISESNQQYYYSGVGKNGGSYLMIKINLRNTKTNPSNYDSYVREYLLDLEGKNNFKYFLYYYGLYYEAKSDSHFLTFEHASCNYEQFREYALINFSNDEKFLIFRQILKVFTFMIDNKYFNPLLKDPNFLYVKESNSNFYEFKFLNLGRIISFLNNISNTIDLTDVLDLYRTSLIEQMEMLRMNFSLNIQLENLDSQNYDSDVLKQFYICEFSKIVLRAYLKKKVTDEEISKLRSFPKEIPSELKSFIQINLKSKMNISTARSFNSTLKNSRDPEGILENYLSKCGIVTDEENMQSFNNSNLLPNHENSGKPKINWGLISNQKDGSDLKTEIFSVGIHGKVIIDNSFNKKFIKTKRSRVEPANENCIIVVNESDLNSKTKTDSDLILDLDNWTESNGFNKINHVDRIEVIDLTEEEKSSTENFSATSLKKMRSNHDTLDIPLPFSNKKEIIVLDSNNSVKSSEELSSSITGEECSNIYLLNKSRHSINNIPDNLRQLSHSNNPKKSAKLINYNNDSCHELFLEKLEKTDKNHQIESDNISLNIVLDDDKENFLFKEKINFMLKNFPRLNDEIINYYYKPFSEEFQINAISSKNIPKLKKKVETTRNSNFNSSHANYLNYSNDIQGNFNININMTNVIINSKINTPDTNQLILNNLNTNIIKTFTNQPNIKSLLSNGKSQQMSENRRIWSSQVLPESEGN